MGPHLSTVNTLLLITAAAAQPDPPPEPPAPPAEPAVEARPYDDYAALTSRLNELAAAARSCSIEPIGDSRGGRNIWALRLADPEGGDPDERPALLLVANIDGSHVAGCAVAVEVVEGLLERADAGDEAAAGLIADRTMYVVPRVNPDAAEAVFAELRTGRDRNLRPDDADRDGAVDEDPPDDLNGDGLITMMRVFDPDEANRMPDPDEPRLDVEPDAARGERAVFRVMTEGTDDDGDGEFNEDAVGGVDLNTNFMHGYPAHADGAGPHQVSEPESRALIDFVLDHQNIAVVLVYGKHDNLSKPPDGKGTYPSGAPKNVSEKDVGLYEYIGERFVELTGLEKVSSPDADGAFFAWAYAQFGVPSFSTPLWSVPPEEDGDGGEPGADEAEGGDGGEENLTPSGIGDISQETIDELRAHAEERGMQITDEMIARLSPQMVEGFARRAGIEIRRVSTDGGAGRSARRGDDAAWLAYSDQKRNGEGFVEWSDVEHPELGTVEVGGWAPYFRTNPPPEAIPGIAGRQIEFVLELAGRLPEVSLQDIEIERLASGLYEVKAALVNDGYFPTGTAMAVTNRRARPHVVRLSVPAEQVVTGDRVSRVWSVAGSGGRESFRWIVRAADGSPLTIAVYSEKYGRFEKTVTLSGGDS